MQRFMILVFTMGSVTSTALRAIRKISPITGRTATSSQHPVRMLFSRRALGVTAATLLVLILLPLRVHGQLDTLPLARTAVLPINTVAGMFENGVHYRLVAASGQVSLFLKNSRGLEFGTDSESCLMHLLLSERSLHKRRTRRSVRCRVA